MFVFLLSAGILVTVAGFFAVGFAIPINRFDLGNTLIIAGSTAICAGLVLIGLAACLRELRRIADALPARVGARVTGGVDAAAEAARVASSPRMPYPTVPGPETPAREPHPFEPRAGAPAAEPPPMEEPVAERPRTAAFSMPRPPADVPLVDEPEGVPLAPSRGPAGGRAPPADAPYEPKFGPADILARLGRPSGRVEPSRSAPTDERPAPVVERPQPAGERPSPPTERPQPPIERPQPTSERPFAFEPAPVPPAAKERPRGPLFDNVWPSAGKPAGRAAGPDSIPRVSSRPEPAEPKMEPRERFEPPPLRSEPPPVRSEPPPLRSEPPTGGEPREPAPHRNAPDPRAVSILKSGVIDGMAYTLYTDGSIEAQLPQGTMRFASIEELRQHLESHE